MAKGKEWRVAQIAHQHKFKDGTIRTFMADESFLFDKEEKTMFFRGVDAEEIDFDTAEKEELEVTDFNVEDLRDYITNKYEVKVGNLGKEKLIDKLLDLRFRSLGGFDPGKAV